MHALEIIFFRWLHIFAACLAVGGAFFMRLFVPIGLKSLDPETRQTVFLKLRRAFKMLIHTCILLLLVSGIYNTVGNWPAYNQIPLRAHPLWGVHVLLGLTVMGIALYVLAGKAPPKSHARWMLLNLLLMAAALGAAAALKYVRDNRRPPAPPPPAQVTLNTNSTSTAAPSGSALTPTAARAWRPASPNTIPSRSLAPLATLACSVKSSSL
jgi:uncharacterized membrane protein